MVESNFKKSDGSEKRCHLVHIFVCCLHKSANLKLHLKETLRVNIFLICRDGNNKCAHTQITIKDFRITMKNIISTSMVYMLCCLGSMLKVKMLRGIV